ncbi:MAG: thioredoxin domain-containing protein [Sediminibacterium sp.]|jgi:rhodanese-related sulfurtransferase|nr:thioredoxin domain-containing protein [Sediminibacterium sp.]
MKCKLCISLFLMVSFLMSCAQTSTNPSLTLNAAAYKEAIAAKNIQVLDVRTAAEFNGGHIKHALQANWLDQKEFTDRTQHLDKNLPVYVYCQAGARSASAQTALEAKGYKVVNLEGGMSNWKMNGFPVDGAGDKAQMRVEDLNTTTSSNKIVLVEVGADWCPPCRKMLPVLETLKQKPAAPFYFLRVDGGNDIDVMKSLKSEGLPTFILFKNGKETWRHEGLVTLEEFNAALSK